jgi:uncharacterized protein (DUF4415 family)
MPDQEHHDQLSADRTSDSQDDVAKTATSKRIGRPPKKKEDKYRPTYIAFHPKIIEWARGEAERRGIGYQSLINEVLLDMINA